MSIFRYQFSRKNMKASTTNVEPLSTLDTKAFTTITYYAITKQAPHLDANAFIVDLVMITETNPDTRDINTLDSLSLHFVFVSPNEAELKISIERILHNLPANRNSKAISHIFKQDN